MKYVPIIDAGIAIANDDGNTAMFDGLKDDIFIKSGNPERKQNDTSNPIDIKETLYGRVWAGYAAFPDWANPKADEYWVDQLLDFHEILPYDGLWLDMNEIANFDTGPSIIEDVLPFEKSVKSKMIYTPGERPLEDSSIAIDGVHSDGHLELDHHSLFGALQGQSTLKFFEQKDMRPFIITRSNFAGSGKWHSHWLGDNFASYTHLKTTIAGIL